MLDTARASRQEVPLNDSSGQLIEVVYAADGYSLAQRVLADNVGTGVVFHKYLSHASDGKLKPRTVVLVEAKPDGFPKEYIAQLFSELVGDKAPLSIIQGNLCQYASDCCSGR